MTTAFTSAPLRKLPIGIQSFERLRSQGYLYVDKTAFVYDLAQNGLPPACFLCRFSLRAERPYGASLSGGVLPHLQAPGSVYPFRSAHARGRADAVVETADTVYVFEFKLYGTAEEAVAQIDDKGYLIPYTADGRHVVKIGVQFSAEERNLERWIIQG